MNLEALAACLTSASCAVTQISTALIVGTLLFLVAAGLSLIFGVLGVINFAHGGFYMLGAYFAFTAYKITGSFITEAKLNPSLTDPWFMAPSPNTVTVTVSARSNFAASAAPHAIGTPAPTMLFSP